MVASGKIVFVISILLFLAPPCSSQSVARKKDQTGRVVYESKPSTVNTGPPLPPIRRENFGHRINEIKVATPATCYQHGGLDCPRGADPKDGSVICLDGFLDSKEDFKDGCFYTKLQFLSESFIGEKGDELKREELYPKGALPVEIRIRVRNLNEIKANNVRVFGVIAERKFPATEVKDIEPYGLEEFMIPINKNRLPPYPNFETRYKTGIECDNCRSTRRSSP